MSHEIFNKDIEDLLGVFQLAISFGRDAELMAEMLASFAHFHHVRCYDYRRERVRQSGFDIRAVMRHVFLTAPRIAVFNSRLYGKSASTRYEQQLIASADSDRTIHIVECGGPILDFPRHTVHRHKGFSEAVALNILQAR